jgi:hypothetical protein
VLAVAQVIKRAVRNVYEMGLEDFIFGHPAQIALLGIQYQWTADTQVNHLAAAAASCASTVSTALMWFLATDVQQHIMYHCAASNRTVIILHCTASMQMYVVIVVPTLAAQCSPLHRCVLFMRRRR